MPCRTLSQIPRRKLCSSLSTVLPNLAANPSKTKPVKTRTTALTTRSTPTTTTTTIVLTTITSAMPPSFTMTLQMSSRTFSTQLQNQFLPQKPRGQTLFRPKPTTLLKKCEKWSDNGSKKLLFEIYIKMLPLHFKATIKKAPISLSYFKNALNQEKSF